MTPVTNTALFAALQPFGRRWITQVVAIGVTLVGIAALAYPHDQASAGMTGGALLLIGGGALAASATQRDRTTSPRVSKGEDDRG